MVAIQTTAPVFERPALRLLPGGRHSALLPDSIYRRRRVVAFVCALVLVVGAWAVALAGFRLLVGGPGSGPLTAPAAAPSAPVPAGAAVHVVEPGDTVWTIARQVTPPDEDVRATVDRIIERNGSAALRPGQRLVLD